MTSTKQVTKSAYCSALNWTRLLGPSAGAVDNDLFKLSDICNEKETYNLTHLFCNSSGIKNKISFIISETIFYAFFVSTNLLSAAAVA